MQRETLPPRVVPVPLVADAAGPLDAERVEQGLDVKVDAGEVLPEPVRHGLAAA